MSGFREIQLTKGKAAIVDEEDYERLSEWKWHATTSGNYAARSKWDSSIKNNRRVLMHREVLNYFGDLDVDHINMNPLDNRKENLRIIEHQKNCFNRPQLGGSSRFKGVYKTKTGRWRAEITINYKRMNLGTYDTQEEAAKAYNVTAVSLVGEFAYLNPVDHDGFKINVKQKTSKYRGVSYREDSKKFLVKVTKDRVPYRLGLYKSEIDAAKAYNEKAIELFGDKAILNVIIEEDDKC
jgi:hypothetical protein